MSRLALALALLPAALTACAGPAPTSLMVVHVEAVAAATCDASPCDLPGTRIGQPHCGFDTSPLDADGGSIHVTSGVPAQQLTGILDLVVLQGDVPNRRQLMADSTRVYPAFGGSGQALYDIDATGTMRAIDDGGAFDGGPITFVYEPDFSDGGVWVSETHRLALLERRPVTISDHSQDPFYGCCAHVDGLTFWPLFALAGLTLRSRRRQGAAGVKTNG